METMQDIPISGSQVRAARALLGWTVHELAHRSVVSVVTIREIEDGAGGSGAHRAHLVAIRTALEREGIEFLDGGAPGVRLVPRLKREK